MKKLLIVILLLLILSSLGAVTVFADSEYVYDTAGILTEDEEYSLEHALASASDISIILYA